ncbi:MAG: rhodanese-like domain-containing protein [Pseudomonadota bacterium]|nr:sulfurtransferase [Pseudomonadales bacterium]MDY6919481.1 rhodanese-like domain-containing protein [Pseudomonadota bacterium]
MKFLARMFSSLIFVLWSVTALAEAPHEVMGAQTVDLTQARNLFDDGAVFIDVRDAQSWSLGHIEGSVNLDFNASEFAVLYISKELDRQTPIVFYTSSPLNVSSAMASFFASNWGYSNVYYFREGFYSWMAADFPVQLKMAGRGPVSDTVIR